MVFIIPWCAPLPQFRWSPASFHQMQLRSAIASSKPLDNLCVQYNEVLLQQARVSAACNALHSIEQRFCRWLLKPMTGPKVTPFNYTRVLSEMLGVRRTSATEVARKIQTLGVIKILDIRSAGANLSKISRLRTCRPACGPIIYSAWANRHGGIVIGTGDLPELALGWCTCGVGA